MPGCTVYSCTSRDNHGNGNGNSHGNSVEFLRVLELLTMMGMEMGRNEKQPEWERECATFPWELIPIDWLNKSVYYEALVSGY